MAKERMSNPVVGDTINLRLFVYNANNLANVNQVSKVDIYFLDPTLVSEINKDGRRLVQSFNSSSITLESTGTYLLTFDLTDPLYVIGKYIDVWSLVFEPLEPPATVTNRFAIYPDLWFTTPIPIVYDFNFKFTPNRIVKGSIKSLIIEIIPNVPTGTDLEKYYENLAIGADLKISIKQVCGDCLPAEDDLRTVVDNVPVDFREKRFGYYTIDTTDMDCGIYDVWFTLNMASNIYVSERSQLQIYI